MLTYTLFVIHKVFQLIYLQTVIYNEWILKRQKIAWDIKYISVSKLI